MASTANGRPSSEPVYIEEPAFSKWLFGSSRAAWIWLVARLWLGWEWLQAGWSKVFGGNITWKFWDWHPDIAYSWYVAWLEWLRDTGHTFFGPLVAVGEVVIGICLILGLFTGIMAFLGAILNFSFVFAGTAGVNPAMIVVSLFLILAWRNAGWYGLDRFVLPRLGTPWHRGELFGAGGEKDSRLMTT
jgi:thiosulfate dehydrogenase (quinone) large subunit